MAIQRSTTPASARSAATEKDRAAARVAREKACRTVLCVDRLKSVHTQKQGVTSAASITPEVMAPNRPLYSAYRGFRCMAATLWRAAHGLPESISCWLERHPDIANSIKWQTVFDTSAYDVPETAKVSWSRWTSRQQADLSDAFDAAWKWMASQSGTVSAAGERLAYRPANLYDTSNDSGSPWTAVHSSLRNGS